MPRECQVGTVPVSITCVICGILLQCSLCKHLYRNNHRQYCDTSASASFKQRTQTPRRLDLHASSRSNHCPVHCLCPPPRPARARIHSSREPSHHRDIAYHLACYKHTRTPQDIGLLRQTPLSTSALSTCARHSAEITLKNGIPRPRIP